MSDTYTVNKARLSAVLCFIYYMLFRALLNAGTAKTHITKAKSDIVINDGKNISSNDRLAACLAVITAG